MSEYPKVVAALALVTGSRAVAEDCVQDALARAWERSERGEHIRSLPAWVTTAALNLSRSWFRRAGAERRARGRLDDPVVASPDDVLEMQQALARLPRRQREATVLRYWLGLDVAEIAAALRVTQGTVKTNLFRARKALAGMLGEEEVADVEP